MYVSAVTHIRLYFHFRIVGPPCVFSCGKKNKVCISTHKHQPSYFVTDLALPSSLPLLSSLPPSLQPLPNSIRPVYSCTMEGTIICFTGFKNKEELVYTSHAHTSFLSLGCAPYNIENLFPSPATYVQHTCISFLELMSCTSTQTCPYMYLTASDVYMLSGV